VDVEVTLLAAKAEVPSKFQAHSAHVAFPMERLVLPCSEPVRVHGCAEWIAGEQSARGVQIELAIRAVVDPSIRGHALVTKITLQVPRRVRRLLQELQGIGMEARLDLVPELGAARVQVEVARLAAVAPLAVRQGSPARIARFFFLGNAGGGVESERVRMCTAAELGLQRATLRVQIVLARLAVVRWPFPDLEAEVADEVAGLVGRRVVEHQGNRRVQSAGQPRRVARCIRTTPRHQSTLIHAPPSPKPCQNPQKHHLGSSSMPIPRSQILHCYDLIDVFKTL